MPGCDAAASGMIFRRANIGDAEAISGLIMSFREVLAVRPDGAGAENFFASVSPDAERRYIRSDRYDYLLAEAGRELAGFIAMRDRTHLFHLFVARSYQRQGLARELWRRAREAAGPRNDAQEFTVNSSLSAVTVYERLGFERTSPAVQQDGVAFVPMRYARASKPP
jgi:GNAT superfamily N-acetyltransferase